MSVIAPSVATSITLYVPSGVVLFVCTVRPLPSDCPGTISKGSVPKTQLAPAGNPWQVSCAIPA